MPYLLDFKLSSNARPDGVEFDEEKYKYREYIKDKDGKFVSTGGLSRGFRYGPDIYPPNVKVYKPAKFFEKQPVFCFGVHWFVPHKFVDIVEFLEPDVHQYIPVNILAKSDVPVEHTYFRLNICNQIRAINFIGSSITPEIIQKIKRDRTVFTLSDFCKIEGHYANPRIALNKEHVGNLHLWRDPQYDHPGVTAFISDELHKKLSWTRRVWDCIKTDMV